MSRFGYVSRLAGGQSGRSLRRRREVDAGEAATLVTPPDGVARVGAGKDLRGVILGVLHRVIAEGLAGGRRPVAARVGGNAPGDEETDVLRLDAAQVERQVIVEAEPGAEVARLGRPWDRAADPDAHALDAVLVPIEPREALAPHLAEPVEAVGPEIAVKTEMLANVVQADCVVRAGEHDAAHPVAPRTLVDLMQPDEVVFDDLRQRALDAGAGEVDQHVDAGEQAIDIRGIAQIAVAEVLAGMQ